MSTSAPTASTPSPPQVGLSGQGRNLALATFAFAVTFWAWNLIGPLGVRYTEQMHLSSSQKALLVATPVLVGSLGRIPVGALTDRYGGRVMFPVLTLLTVPFVLLVALAGNLGSFPLMLLFGFFLGIGGTTFAVGVPFVNAWYQADRRGFATGVFGAGMGGTALSSALTPRMVTWFGYTLTHVIIAVLLVATAALCWSAMRNSPAWTPNTDPVVPKLAAAIRLPVTWQMSFLYAVAFGGFVAFSTYLPTFLKDVYAFDLTAAGTRTAGFAVAAVVARPIGGVLSDRIGPRAVLAHLALRHDRSRGRPGVPAAPRGGGGPVVRRDGLLPRPGHRRRLRLGRAPRTAGAGGQRDRPRRRRRRPRRLLPAPRPRGDLRQGLPAVRLRARPARTRRRLRARLLAGRDPLVGRPSANGLTAGTVSRGRRRRRRAHRAPGALDPGCPAPGTRQPGGQPWA